MNGINFGSLAKVRQEDICDISVTLPKGKDSESFIVPRETLHGGGHIHVQGRTRSGKSSRILNPLIKSLLLPYGKDDQSKDVVFVFDLGGDLSLLQASKAQAELTNRGFKFVSLNHDEAWSTFDPFQGMRESGSAMAIAEFLASAFSLDYGLFYGGSHFSRLNVAILLDVAKQMDKMGEEATLAKIVEHLRLKGRGAEEVSMCFRALLEFPQLSQRIDGNEVNFEEAIETGEVIYFFMPTLSGANSARQIASLAMYSALLACMKRVHANQEKRNVFFVIDEFQELVSRSFSSLVSQCGKFGVTLVMANQTTSQLENRDVNVAEVVRDNTILKLYLTYTTERDLESMQLLSKDVLSTLRTKSSRTTGLVQATESERDVITPSLSKNLALEVSATEGCFFAMLDNGKGHRNPKVVYAEHGNLENTHRAGYVIEKRDNKKLFADGSHRNKKIGTPWQANYSNDPEYLARQKKLRSSLEEGELE